MIQFPYDDDEDTSTSGTGSTESTEIEAWVNCNHKWVDLGPRRVFCKHCDVDGEVVGAGDIKVTPKSRTNSSSGSNAATLGVSISSKGAYSATFELDPDGQYYIVTRDPEGAVIDRKAFS